MKQIVKYNLNEYSSIVLNRNAIVSTIDHPSHRVSNTKPVRTSTVVSVDGDDFETLNTRYIGVHADKEEI